MSGGSIPSSATPNKSSLTSWNNSPAIREQHYHGKECLYHIMWVWAWWEGGCEAPPNTWWAAGMVGITYQNNAPATGHMGATDGAEHWIKRSMNDRCPAPAAFLKVLLSWRDYVGSSEFDSHTLTNRSRMKLRSTADNCDWIDLSLFFSHRLAYFS